MSREKQDEPKKGLLLGSMQEVRDWLEEKVDELIEEGEKKARHWKDTRVREGQKRKEIIDLEDVKEKTEEFLSSFGFASRNDLAEIKDRLDDLEVLIEHKGFRAKAKSSGKKKK